ncbi:uncharacterized protein [Littorina saxatilis]|uniref:Peroxin-19 n=1 Tax=Littorina saxatilis TaxID=31220 RepID=A0AAN9BHI7_9CAEN
MASTSSSCNKPERLPPVTEDTATSRAGQAVEHTDTPPSPRVDVFAVLGIPRPKRPSDKSDEAEGIEEAVDDDSDDCSDTDDETEVYQEGEYLVMEEDDELKELQIQMLSENAGLSRASLVPIFTSCSEAYKQWLVENNTSAPKEELDKRNQQLQLYRKVLELYGSDEEWNNCTHAQRVERNQEAHDTSLQAKELGPPPDEVAKTMIVAAQKKQSDTILDQHFEK